MRRYPLQWSIVVSMTLGLAGMVLASKATDRFGRWPDEGSDLLGASSLISGGLVAVLSFVSAFGWLRSRALLHPIRSDASLRASRKVLLAMAPAIGLVGLGILLWILAWRIPLTSLEGVVWWPLGILPVAVSYFLFRRARNIKRYLDAPPNHEKGPRE